MTVALSFTGFVFGMQQTDVKPPAAAARAPDLDGLGVLETRLAKMHVHVDEAGRDDHAGCVEHLGTRRVQIRDPISAIDAILQQHVGDPIVPGRRIDHAAVPDEAACSLQYPFQHRHAHGDAVFHLVQESPSAASRPPRTRSRGRD